MQADAKQAWSATSYNANAAFVSAYGEDVVALLAPQPGERILDLGCGEGTLAEQIAAAGASVVGVDSSPEFVEAAVARGVDARVADGEALAFEAEFDAVFTNAALHWMLRPEAVIAGVKRALRPGGRFVGEFGGHGNVAAIATALRALAPQFDVDPALASPWFFPTPERYSAMLEAEGFSVDSIALIHRQTPLPGAMGDWLRLFRTPYFAAAGERADALVAAAEDLLAPALKNDKGGWTADYVRLRFAAHA